MRGQLLIIGFLAAGCTDELDRKTDRAADRVQAAQDRLRHERRQLSVEVAEHADAVFENSGQAKQLGDIGDEVGAVTRKAVELARADADFQYLKSLRVQSLRAEHSVIAIQPLLIQAISTMQPPLPAVQRRLDENLVILRQRLAATRDMIEELSFVSASDWERHDDAVAQEMASLSIARDASWQALGGRVDEVHFPQT